jgi:hypothetical protein
MFKNYIYLNILFIFGLVVYLFSQNFSLTLQNSFYLFFGLFGIIVPGLYLSTGFKFKSVEEKSAYQLLFIGFWVYGCANFIWYLNESFTWGILEELLNLLFIFQVFTKDYFLRFLAQDSKNGSKKSKLGNLFSINLGFWLLLLLCKGFLNLEIPYDNLFFIFDSLISILFLSLYGSRILGAHLDLNYFTLGCLIWLVGDLIYFYESYLGIYLMGDIADFIYYFGFYLLLTSVLFKNFSFVTKFNYYFENKLSFS